MFRPSDFDSNIVSRFPTTYIYQHDSLSIVDGITSKSIFTSGEYFPGSEIHGIQLSLSSSSNNNVNLIIGSESNSPIISSPILSGEIIQLLDLLPTSMKLGNRGLVLPPSTELFIGLDNQLLVDEFLFVHIVGVGY